MPDQLPDAVPQPCIAALDDANWRTAFADHLGLRLESTSAGEAVVSLELRPELLGAQGSGHTGVLMTLLETAMTHAALSRLAYAREVVTVDIRVGFMRATQGRLVATGQAVGGGKSVCFCEARLLDETGEVRAQAMGTFRYGEAA
ncbi:MAG: PaaI family thioesterase [Rhodoferax sp.]